MKRRYILNSLLSVVMMTFSSVSLGDVFYKGVDLSYVNQMEDCGETYFEGGSAKDPYQIMADNGSNLVRVRLWHDPLAWTNYPSSYSGFNDVKETIQRSKAAGMQVLLDFHYSDTWADPGKQYIPAAWAALINNTPALATEVYDYTHQVLSDLAAENLLPEFVQVGNETNGNIMNNTNLFPINWTRQATLFNSAISAIRDIDASNNTHTKVVLHVADPSNGSWWINSAKNNGITDFDIIGLSYYPQWHGSTVAAVGSTIANLKTTYSRNVMLVEVGTPWTTGSGDSASNILGTAPSGYSATATGQRDWLIDLSNTVHANGGVGVVYWEPAWVSNSCGTEWAGTGSHYENATFFDFGNHLMTNGGVQFLALSYAAVDTFTAAVTDAGQESGSGIQGQAFAPVENATPNPGFPDTVYLTSMTFTQGANSGGGSGITVDIYRPTSDATLATAEFIGKSTNALDTSMPEGTDYIFTFDNLPLDFNATYLAIFKDSSDQLVGLGLYQGWEGNASIDNYERGGGIWDYDTWGWSDSTSADFSAQYSTLAPESPATVSVPLMNTFGLLLLFGMLASIVQSARTFVCAK